MKTYCTALFLLGVAAFSGCSKQDAKPPPPKLVKAIAVKPDEPWTVTPFTDSMTDETSVIASAKDKLDGATFTVACNARGFTYLVSSDFLVGVGPGRFMYRLDQEKPVIVDATLENKTTKMVLPENYLSGTGSDYLPKEEFSIAMDAFSLQVSLMTKDYKRLRTRLMSFGGETKDFNFDVSGNRAMIHTLMGKCADMRKQAKSH